MTKEENEKRLAYLKGIVSRLPEKPGSYQYYDEEHTIIYVGKAKNLKSRVSSYFHTEVDRFKTKILVSKIWDISYTVVNTEEDALLLENSLINKYNPRYNVLLKDGKTYPSICVTNEYLPRIFKTRTINKKWGTYYGPYSHIGTMYGVLDLIKELYLPRTCRQPITKEGIETGKYKVCLDYHIKKCKGACVGKQTLEDYQKNIQQAREILKGNTRQVLRDLREEMLRLSEELRFEEAEEIKRKYPNDFNRMSKLSIIEESMPKKVRMANLCIVSSTKVNGVAKIHSGLLRTDLFKEFYELWPEKFTNVTNGVTPRRWVHCAFPELSKLLTKYNGGRNDWLAEYDLLEEIPDKIKEDGTEKDFMERLHFLPNHFL